VADDLFHAEIVTPAHARGEGIETRHLATTQPCLFGSRALLEHLHKRSLRRTRVVEVEDSCDVKKGPTLVAERQDPLVTV